MTRKLVYESSGCVKDYRWPYKILTLKLVRIIQSLYTKLLEIIAKNPNLDYFTDIEIAMI